MRAASEAAEVLDLLARGELRLLGLLPRASNHTFLAEISGGDAAVLAVYKPRAGETPLWDFPEGTLCRREVAAYEMAQALGWPAVPPTVLRDGPFGMGSAQLFIEADPAHQYFTLRDLCPDAFPPVAAFDVVVGNGDRKAGHCLLDREGTVWAVDHGLCFNATPWLRTVIWDFAGQPVPRALLDDLRRVAEDLRGGALRERMLGLLAPEEVDATAGRAEDLVATATFPEPGARRSRPWPAV
ncbi:MAG TPA: SCO1664 family protein [Actinomycetota bacterium]|nr:SCO1664 family protein [Actinomycetota bacterium]